MKLQALIAESWSMVEHRYFLRGEIDIATAPQMHTDLRELVTTTTDDIVVDCCGLTFIDSSGLAALVAIGRLLHERGRRLRLANTSDTTERLLEIMGIRDLLLATESHG